MVLATFVLKSRYQLCTKLMQQCCANWAVKCKGAGCTLCCALQSRHIISHLAQRLDDTPRRAPRGGEGGEGEEGRNETTQNKQRATEKSKAARRKTKQSKQTNQPDHSSAEAHQQANKPTRRGQKSSSPANPKAKQPAKHKAKQPVEQQERTGEAQQTNKDQAGRRQEMLPSSVVPFCLQLHLAALATTGEGLLMASQK